MTNLDRTTTAPSNPLEISTPKDNRTMLRKVPLDWDITQRVQLMYHSCRANISATKMGFNSNRKFKRKYNMVTSRRLVLSFALVLLVSLLSNSLMTKTKSSFADFLPFVSYADASLIIGDSAIEIQEVDDGAGNAPMQNNAQLNIQPSSSNRGQADSLMTIQGQTTNEKPAEQSSNQMPGPLPPVVISRGHDDVTDGDKRSRGSHDYDMRDISSAPKSPLSQALSPSSSDIAKDVASDAPEDEGKPIAGKVVDFELTPAGGHNKAKIKKKKKKKKEESMHKKWAKKKKSEKKAMEKKHKEHMKKKKEEGKLAQVAKAPII